MTDLFHAKAAGWDDDPVRVDRAARTARAMTALTGDVRGKAVADAGCGTGLLGWHFLQEGARVWFLDPSPAMLGVLEGKLRDSPLHPMAMACLTDTRLSPADARAAVPRNLDAVVSLLALHHMDDLPGNLRAMAAMLAPGGVLCLADLDTEDGSFHEGDKVPHEGIDRAWLQELLQEAGLQPFHGETLMELAKILDGQERRYPLFLVAARKA